MAKRPLSRIDGHVVELFAGQNSTSGGSSETEVTEFADIATGPSGPLAVTTVTPVGRCPRTLRKRSASIRADASMRTQVPRRGVRRKHRRIPTPGAGAPPATKLARCEVGSAEPPRHARHGARRA